MIKGSFPIEEFAKLKTPFYYYDMRLLQNTLQSISSETEDKNYHVHYALKANSNKEILKEISKYGFGADCVSGNEILRALDCGFAPEKIVFAGVGKTEEEIEIALHHNIFCFNVESIPEIELIAELSQKHNRVANIAFRINPNVDAHTHEYITTGLSENKFGLNDKDVPNALDLTKNNPHLNLIGIHFHIGSQITDLTAFENLCIKAREWQDWFSDKGIKLQTINVGGGLGINYQHPNHCPIADFSSYLNVFNKYLQLDESQDLHFELGRSIVGPCGSLISRVNFVKQGINKNFLILDAGMTELIRPALYKAYHHIENLSSEKDLKKYDIVGPVCESSDTFAENRFINEAERGDFIAIRSAGAYGEIMSSRYNLRDFPKAYYSF